VGSANGVFLFEGMRLYTASKEFRVGGTVASVAFNNAGDLVFRKDGHPSGSGTIFTLVANGDMVMNGNGAGFYISGGVVVSKGIVSEEGNVYSGTGAAAIEAHYWIRNTHTQAYLYLDPANGTFGFYDTGATRVRFNTDVAGNFTAAGNITAYSDARLKESLLPYVIDLDHAASMLGTYSYTRKDTGAHSAGGIAQELIEVLPECVQADDNDTLSVDYGRAAYMLVVAMLKERAHGHAR
jgi:hypothetical protein